MTEVAVLIAERGARWSDWARAWCGPARELVLLIQHGQETQAEFRSRIEQGLERMHRRTAPVQQVVLVAGERSDGPTLLARAQLVRAILGKLRQAGKAGRPTQLVLDAGTGKGPALRKMQELADSVAASEDAVTATVASLMVPLSAGLSPIGALGPLDSRGGLHSLDDLDGALDGLDPLLAIEPQRPAASGVGAAMRRREPATLGERNDALLAEDASRRLH